jgi:uncharacterized protein involved in outer membrane biogenesis
MRRALKILGWTLGVLVVLIGAAGTFAYYFVTSDYLRNRLESEADTESGRVTKIGKLAVDWGWTTHIHIEQVEISNADWGKAPQMFAADEIECDIRLWPLIKGHIELPRLRLVKPSLSVEKNDRDELNWSEAQAPATNTALEAATPARRDQMPLIGRLEIVDGRLAYRDAKRKLSLDGTVNTAMGQAGSDSPEARLFLKGNLESQPLSLRFTGGSVIMLRDTDTPYPIDLDVQYGDTHLTVKGKLQDPLQFQGANVTLTLSGQDLAQIYPLLGIPGPPTPPYQIEGQLDRSGQTWTVDTMKWHVGESDLAGSLTLDESVKPAKLTAKLTSQNLLFADLAPLVGASPGQGGTNSEAQKKTEATLQQKGELFPDVPLHVERLRAMTMDVSLDARKVVAPDYLPVDTLFFHVVIEDGKATVKPLKMSFGGGTVEGALSIDAKPDLPTVETGLKLDQISLAEFFRNSRFFDTTEGKLDGRIDLTGQGKSLAAVMGSANGEIVVTMGGGTISDLMISAADLQLASALALYITGDHRIPVRCMVSRLTVKQGDVTFERTLLDTTRSVLHVDGDVNLGDQATRMTISADPKTWDLLDLHAPVLLNGKIRDPHISIGRKIPIPLPDFGGAKDAPCDRLTQDIMNGEQDRSHE